MKRELVSVNGCIVPLEIALVPVNDKGLMFGWGIFETIAVYREIPFLLERHIMRLKAAVEKIGINYNIDTQELSCMIEAYIKRAQIDSGVIRVTVTKGEAAVPNTIITCREKTYNGMDYQTGFRLKCTSSRRNPASLLVGIKSLNYAENIIEKEQAVKSGFNEALFLNIEGWVSECSSSNIFFIKNGQLHTPSKGCGLLEGITAKFLEETIMPPENLKVIEGKFTLEDIYTADEVFITNSVMEVMPVVGVDDVQIGNGVPGGLTRLLMDKYRGYVNSYIGKARILDN